MPRLLTQGVEVPCVLCSPRQKNFTEIAFADAHMYATSMTQRNVLKATVPDRMVWLPKPACVIAAVRLSKALETSTQRSQAICKSVLPASKTLFDQKNILSTLWRLGGFGDFRKKNSSFRLPYHRASSSADYARELFNCSNGSASLVDCTRKKTFCLGGAGFLWVTS